jgi:hypothetical protein
MSDVSRWRDSGHLERAVETAGGQQAFAAAVAAMLQAGGTYRSCLVSGPPASSSSTRLSATSDSRAVRTQPADPAPTIVVVVIHLNHFLP